MTSQYTPKKIISQVCVSSLNRMRLSFTKQSTLLYFSSLLFIGYTHAIPRAPQELITINTKTMASIQEMALSKNEQDICQSFHRSSTLDIHAPLYCRDKIGEEYQHGTSTVLSADQIAKNTQDSLPHSEASKKTLTVSPFMLSHKTVTEGIENQVSLPGNKNGHRVEIEVKRIEQDDWLSSEYMLSQLSRQVKSKAARDIRKHHEAAIMQDQINRMKGQHYINGKEATQRYRQLLDAGVEFAKKHQVVLGSPLSADQMRELKQDIVWLVNETITVDGAQFEVLVPQIYIAHPTVSERRPTEVAALSSDKKEEANAKAEKIVKQFGKRIIHAYQGQNDVLGAESNYEMMQRGLTLTVSDGISAVQHIMEHSYLPKHQCDIPNLIEHIKQLITDWEHSDKTHTLIEYLETHKENKRFNSFAVPLKYLTL